jgi:hypothetical protein
MNEQSTLSRSEWWRHAMINGLVLGLIQMLIFFVLYFLEPSKLAGFSYLLVTLALNIAFPINRGIAWRKALDGYMSFGEGFKHAGVLLITSGLLQLVLSMIFILVEPAMPEVLAQAQLDSSLYWAEKFGAPEETLDTMKEQFDMEEITSRFSITGMIKGFGISLIFYALGALIIAIFTRKNPPELV